MNPTLTAQQIAYFAKNGHIELEGLLSLQECQKLLGEIRKAAGDSGRDLWRSSPTLKTFALSRKLSSLVSSLEPKLILRLGFDHWFTPSFSLPTPTKGKELFSIQGITALLFIRLEPAIHPLPVPTSPIGLLPFPSSQGSVLIVHPNLLLNWPISKTNPNLYLIAYCQSNSVYIHNPRDPAGTSLRELGLGYGDSLKEETHPTLRTS